MTYQLFPNLTADEFEALTADIRERGVMVPVELDEDVDRIERTVPAAAAAAERHRWSALMAANSRVLTEGTPEYWADRLDAGQVVAEAFA